MTPPSSGRWLRAALLVLVAALLAAPAARAAVDDDEIPSRPELYAKALRKDPVYVSPSAVRAVPPADLRRLRRAVAAMPYRTYVLVVPRFWGEPGMVGSDGLIVQTQDRLGRRGLFVTVDPDGSTLTAKAIEVRVKGQDGRAQFAARNAVGRDASVATTAIAALDYLRTGRGDPAYHAERSSYSSTDARDVVPWVMMGVGALLAFAVPLAVWWRRERHRRGPRPAKHRRPRRDPLSAPSRGEARREALEAIAALAKELDRTDAPPTEALRAYDAASHVAAGRRPEVVDWVGAQALAQRGLATLHGRPATPCFFDPRHGAGNHPTRWRRGGEEVRIPTCRACAKALRDDEPPAVLADDGRPYWERDTVWATTGFGAIEDRVADVVLAGPGGRR
ncbi:hypothetical protein [Patulibacter sp. SYSU D01012]|uniref:hypothetical protein n=1 Tax=Patulibacter sp. SYSU D01012 TaxID=2817381 RepID=UPI001B309AB6|nr:hypothetical protein [Patulibacter sp. SYSU D01012]